MYAVKLGYDGSVSVVENTLGQGFLEFCYDNIGCEYVEQVSAKYLDAPYVLMIDEEGLLGDRPMVNVIASYLYGTHEHLQPIVGNALIVILDRMRHDFDYLNSSQAAALERSMQKLLPTAYRSVGDALKDCIMEAVDE